MPLLQPGEAILRSERAESGKGRDGSLFLTNRRIIFEGSAADGVVRKMIRGERTVTLLDLQLVQLSNVHGDKPLFGRSVLRIEAAGQNFSFKVGDADAWHAAVMRAHQGAALPPPPPGYGAPVVVNVQTAPPQQTPVQSFLHCTHCGSLMPSVSTKGMRCSNCGAAL